jgi:undecaprenyl-diphosphatase
MNIFDLLILSIIQGLTEFLPVSSSAHLILISEFLDSNDQGIVFDVAVHLGTLFAAMIYFRKEVAGMLRGLSFNEKNKDETHQLVNIVIAVLPILILGFLLRDFVDQNLRSSEVIAYATIFFGLILLWSDRIKTTSDNIDQISNRQAFIIGLSQCLALIPGTSRSGITISAALFMGIGREAAAKFSFLLAIPTIGAIAASELINLSLQDLLNQGVDLMLAGVISFGVAYFTIDVFLKLVKRYSFTPFVVYRVLLGAWLLSYWV